MAKAGHLVVTPPPLPSEQADWPMDYRDQLRIDRVEVGDRAYENRGYAYAYHSRRQATLTALKQHAPPPGRLLDIAGAAGNFSIAAAQMGYDVVWNDLRGEMADYVRLKAPLELSIEYVAGNILEIGGAHEGAYDVVLALEVIEHVAWPDRFLASLAKLVKPGGHLVLTTPNGGYFLNKLPRFSDVPDPSVFEEGQFRPDADGHIFLLYEDEMRRFGEEAALDLIDYRLITNILTSGHFKTGHLLSALPRSFVDAIERMSRALPRGLSGPLMAGSLAVYRRP